MTQCLHCKQKTNRTSYTYCSNKCQSQHQYSEYIKKWKKGLVAGSRGIETKNISRHIKRFLMEKYGNMCTLCGWSEVNVVTGIAPLEIDHRDGNAENNTESNLRLLCPNCHSLTPNFRNLNKNKGRIWRRIKYKKSKG